MVQDEPFLLCQLQKEGFFGWKMMIKSTFADACLGAYFSNSGCIVTQTAKQVNGRCHYLLLSIYTSLLCHKKTDRLVGFYSNLKQEPVKFGFLEIFLKI